MAVIRKMENKLEACWSNLPVSNKLMMEIVLTAAALFASNLLIYAQINRMVGRMDSVYVSNVNLGELSDCLDAVQNDMYRYLEVRNSDSLTAYYRSEQDYRELLTGLNERTTDNQPQLLEKNIRNMSVNYLEAAGKAVQAKRSQNVEQYQSAYERALQLYRFINHDITDLNAQQFRNNSASYQTLQSALNYLEIVSLIILVIVMVISVSVMMILTRNVVTPLTNLAQTARLVGEGNFHVKVPQIPSKDELGIVTTTFNQMVDSLEDYVKKIRKSAEKEKEMQARELLMQSNLKEARLCYLQSQINPHFLFNSLNAGVQLSAMENAEKTSVFIEKMAEFLRYNVKKGMEDATVREEVETVENYIYILNVRFAGEIHYHSHVDRQMLDYRIPSMILQPLVENAVTHGLRNLERQGEICLRIRDAEERIEICVEDDGYGMSREMIRRICSGEQTEHKEESTGVGLKNVITRLRLYYNTEDVFRIVSEGEDRGTKVILMLPKKEGE